MLIESVVRLLFRTMSLLCLRVRTLLLLVTTFLGVASVVFLMIQQDAKPSLDRLVSETQRRLKRLNENPQELQATEAEPYLSYLGLHSDSNLTSKDVDDVLPTVVVPVLRSQGESAVSVLNAVRETQPKLPVVIYDLGLGYYERQRLKDVCGLTKCSFRDFPWSKLPSHVGVVKYEAYRSVAIQESLNMTGAVLYLSPARARTVPTEPELNAMLEVGRKVGVAAFFPLIDSTSSMTHPKMFSFFRTSPTHFYFHRGVLGDRLLVFNTNAVRRAVMTPWVRCALTPECLAPTGSQDTGCRRYRKPLYLYSGCHHYDLSALNVVLGAAFRFDSSVYTVTEGGNGSLPLERYLEERIPV